MVAVIKAKSPFTIIIIVFVFSVRWKLKHRVDEKDTATVDDDLNRKHAIFIKKKFFCWFRRRRTLKREEEKNEQARRIEETFQRQEMIIIKFPFVYDLHGAINRISSRVFKAILWMNGKD